MALMPQEVGLSDLFYRIEYGNAVVKPEKTERCKNNPGLRRQGAGIDSTHCSHEHRHAEPTGS